MVEQAAAEGAAVIEDLGERFRGLRLEEPATNTNQRCSL